jgi:hypothetical protein
MERKGRKRYPTQIGTNIEKDELYNIKKNRL